MEQGTKTILGIGFLALLGWWLFKKPNTAQNNLEVIPTPPTTSEDKFKVLEDTYFNDENGNVAFIIPKDTIVSGKILDDGSLQVSTAMGNATIIASNFQSVASDTPKSEQVTLGCFSYKVKNVNDVMMDDDGGIIDVASDLHYVTCEGEPNDMTLSTADGEVVVRNVIEGSILSGDTKILITKA